MYTTTIDSQQQRVTVTANVDVQILIKRLIKMGKHAEIWQENLEGKEKIFMNGKSKNKEKEKDPEIMENSTTNPSTKKEAKISSTTTSDHLRNTSSGSSETEKLSKTEESQRSTEEGKSPEESLAGEDSVGKEAECGGEKRGGGSKKKKRKGQKGNDRSSNGCLGKGNYGTPACTRSETNDQGQSQSGGSVNLNHTSHYLYPYPLGYYPHLVYASIYNAPHPSKTPGPFWCIPSPPYTCANGHQEIYGLQAMSLGSFEIFSDENANGCFIM